MLTYPKTTMRVWREILSTTNKDISVNVDLSLIDNARTAYANAFEFGPRDFDAAEIPPH